MNLVKILIIMPCLNAESYIPESIASALNPIFYHVERVVVNDGSIDKVWKYYVVLMKLVSR
jgi:glycosyltransferase involved in cell wall biosynthesis